MLSSISGRGYAKPPLEYITEIIRIRIAYLPRYHITFIIGLNQQPGSLIHTVIRQIPDKRIPRLLFENSGKI